MNFSSRTDAGGRLGVHLQKQNLSIDLLVGLPRGGVIVAAEVARILQRPLHALVVRKIGHPDHREYAVGALAEDGTVVFNEDALSQTRVKPVELEGVIAEESKRLAAYQNQFHPQGMPVFKDKGVLIVDDGWATGLTTEVAIRSVRAQGAAQIVVAAPVASDDAMKRLGAVANRVITLFEDSAFEAVGRYYQSFPQSTDEEVVRLLSR